MRTVAALVAVAFFGAVVWLISKGRGHEAWPLPSTGYGDCPDEVVIDLTDDETRRQARLDAVLHHAAQEDTAHGARR